MTYWKSDNSGRVLLDGQTVTRRADCARVHQLIDALPVSGAFDKAFLHAAFENHQVIEIGYMTARVPGERVTWKSA